MAGEWLQIDLDLPEKPEVQAIARASAKCPSMSEVSENVRSECALSATLGRLLLFWRWVERHASSDLVRRADVHTLVSLCGGDEQFWHSVEAVGWVSFTEEGVVIPGWKKRFSKSAKNRAKDAKRKREVRKHSAPRVRKTSEECPQNVRDERTKLGPKEEKRRVDIKESIFAAFWEAYPKRNGRKVGKDKAAALFANLSPDDRQLAVQAARNYAASDDSNRGYARDAERFLKSSYWRDWLENVPAPSTSRAPTDEDLANWNPVDGGLGTEFDR